MSTSTEAAFALGSLCITRGALRSLDPRLVAESLWRHSRGDWGELDPEDLATNERALLRGGRLFSAYGESGKNRLYIITEADRSATTILLPSEY